MLRPFDIIELACFGGPEKNEPGSEADEEHENDEGSDGPEHRVKLQWSSMARAFSKSSMTKKGVSFFDRKKFSWRELTITGR
jgi:hypothetical protein